MPAKTIQGKVTEETQVGRIDLMVRTLLDLPRSKLNVLFENGCVTLNKSPCENPAERVALGDNIVITVLRTKGKAVRLGIEAPNEVPVLRGELAFDDGPIDSSTNCETATGSTSNTSVHFDRVSRAGSQDRRTTVMAPLVADGGPLRAMLNSRVTAR